MNWTLLEVYTFRELENIFLMVARMKVGKFDKVLKVDIN